MHSMSRQSAAYLFACLAALGSGAASAATVSLTGNPAADGWTLVGNSRDATNIIWARGNDTNYNAFITTFHLSAGQSFTGTGFRGNDGGLQVSGGWQVGDRILGLGITSTTNLGSATFKVDFGGAGSFAPAPVLDGVGGVASFGAGGGPGAIQAQSLQAIPNGQYRALDQQYKDQAGNVTAAGAGIEYESALRAWALVDGIDENSLTFNEMAFLVNYDQLLRLGMPVGAIGSISRFSMNADGADVSFSRALSFGATPSPVSAPGALALVGLGLLLMGGLKRARS